MLPRLAPARLLVKKAYRRRRDFEFTTPCVDLVDHFACNAHTAVLPGDGRDRGSGRAALSARVVRATGRAVCVNAEEETNGVVAEKPNRTAAVTRTGIDRVAKM